MNLNNNKLLRQRINQERIKLSPEFRLKASEKIKTSLCGLEIFKNNKNYAIYLPYKNEVDTLPIITWLWENEKNCYLPIINLGKQNLMSFGLYKKEIPLSKNRYGILEPMLNNSEKIHAKDLDVVIEPLVGFDVKGNRLGSGKGYYDRAFSFKKRLSVDAKPYLIGIAYELQKVPELAAKPWDIPLQIIITEETIYYPKNV
jgi:5-formyltetrahydrofolate cyclo-ligase